MPIAVTPGYSDDGERKHHVLLRRVGPGALMLIAGVVVLVIAT
jgi:hypothetical protein